MSFQTVTLLFEVENLAVIKSWIEALPSNTFNADRKKVLNNYFRNYLENILNLTENMLEMEKHALIKVKNVINIVVHQFKQEFGFEPCFGQSAQQSDEEDGVLIMKKDTKQGVKLVTVQADLEICIQTIFFYACVWGVG
ncbi:MAG: hypothetical protein EZS28_034807 [Streblomastix strix]|uniref:Uncharacterized protein n=1 Tax=Streblomastix strix TaxID=222440 RepID=A0A5J4UGY6_9EUKA|nr:MAG: hypothetical protein EZS28_034807 [Streblomastix strix]